MATNPYSYGSLGQRWTVGEPTSKSLLDVSRVKADANRWALEQLVVDPDDTANFVLTAPGLNIDSNTLYVDSVNNSVGFGLTNPNDYAFNGTPSWVASGGAGNASVIVVSGTTSTGYLSFADGTTGTDRYSGNIQYNHGTNTMSFRTNGGVEAMTINSAQDVAVNGDTLFVDASADRVGINTSSPTAPLEVYASATTAQNAAIVIDGPVNNYEGVQYRVGGVDVGYTAQEATGRMYHGAGIEHRFRTGSGSVVGGTDALTIDSSQRVGIGTDSPSALAHLYSDSSGSLTELRIEHNNTSEPATAIVRFKRAGADFAYIGGAAAAISGASSTDLGLTVPSGKNIVFATDNTERARIDSSGNLLVGRTNPNLNTESGTRLASDGLVFFERGGSGISNVMWINRQSSAGDGNLVSLETGGSQKGSISISGSTTSFNTTSDYRLKENVVSITDGITRIKSLKPSRFNFISNADRTVDGFVAHEVSDIVPEAVTGEKDAVDDEGNPKYQGIDQSKLVPLLTAALQEAITKIETLETKVAALEAA